MKQSILLVIILPLLIALLNVSSYSEVIHINDDSDTTIDIVYFYVNMCESCTESKEIIDNFADTIKESHIDIKIRLITYNIGYYDGSEYDLYLSYLDYYGLNSSKTSAPILFIGTNVFEGEESIHNGLNESLIDMKNGSLPQTPILDISKDKTKAIDTMFQGFSALKMLGIGFINGLNPCSLSMILLLISILMMKNISLIRVTLTYLGGKWLAFLLLGSVLYQFLDYLNNTSFLFFSKLIISLFILVIASLNIYDFFKSRQESYGEIKNQLPRKLRFLNHQLIKRLTVSNNKIWLYMVMFLLGFLIAIGEFLCTGQLYVITINYMIRTNDSLNLIAILYLGIYAFGFIIPPVVAVIIVQKTDTYFGVSEYIREKMPYIKLITAITLIILGIVTLLY